MTLDKHRLPGSIDKHLPDGRFKSTTTERINTERGYISGLLAPQIDSSTVGIDTGQCISDSDDETIIDVDSSLSADLTTTGAGGRQSGQSEQASTWYGVYVIADSEGESPAGFLVAEGQTLSLPSGYTTYRRLGWVRNSSSSDIHGYYNPSPGRWYWDKEVNHEAVDDNTPPTSFTRADSMPDNVPPTATEAVCKLISIGDGTAAKHRCSVQREGSEQVFSSAGWAAHGTDDAYSTVQLPLNDSQYIRYKGDAASDRVIVRVHGWVDPR